MDTLPEFFLFFIHVKHMQSREYSAVTLVFHQILGKEQDMQISVWKNANCSLNYIHIHTLTQGGRKAFTHTHTHLHASMHTHTYMGWVEGIHTHTHTHTKKTWTTCTHTNTHTHTHTKSFDIGILKQHICSLFFHCANKLRLIYLIPGCSVHITAVSCSCTSHMKQTEHPINPMWEIQVCFTWLGRAAAAEQPQEKHYPVLSVYILQCLPIVMPWGISVHFA